MFDKQTYFEYHCFNNEGELLRVKTFTEKVNKAVIQQIVPFTYYIVVKEYKYVNSDNWILQ